MNSLILSRTKQKTKQCYAEYQVINMFEFLIDDIFVVFGGQFVFTLHLSITPTCIRHLYFWWFVNYEIQTLLTGFHLYTPQRPNKTWNKRRNNINIFLCHYKISTLDSYIPAPTAYRVYIQLFMRYARGCSFYSDPLKRVSSSE